MAEKKNELLEARAPYNFVPFSKKMPIRRYQSLEELPPHNVIDPRLLTGEIQVTLTAQSPVFISAGLNAGGKQHFYSTGDGRYAIPGSTLRGMVRQNMQTLGMGVIRPGLDLEDRHIFYRKITAQKKRARQDISVAVKDPLVEYYQSVLSVESKDRVTIPKTVKAGYLFRDAEGYHIEPTPQGRYIRISRAQAKEFLNPSGDLNAQCFPVAYEHNGERLLQLRCSDAPVDGLSFGTLLFTGKSVGKPNHCYIFPEPEPDQEPVVLSGEDVLSYELDYKDRVNTVKAYYSPEFWALPKAGERKPVFYASAEGHTYWGMSLFLRIGYRFSLADGLPQTQKDANAEDLYLDYIYSLMGFIGDGGSYQSRLSFEDAPLQGAPHTAGPVAAILAGPKPSYYMGYSQQGLHYNEEDFQLRGYKFYWMKEFQKLPTPEKEKVATTLYPLKAGASFQGTIHFRNLHADELGLLLWCLRLEEGCFQSLGMGKPLGLGRMALTIDSLRTFDLHTLYRDLTAGADTVRPDLIEHYIRLYDTYACQQRHIKKPTKKPSIRSLEEIQDFFFAHSHLADEKEASYMALEEYRFIKLPLPSTEEIRRKNSEPAQEEKPQALDPFAALQAKFNQNSSTKSASAPRKKKKW